MKNSSLNIEERINSARIIEANIEEKSLSLEEGENELTAQGELAKSQKLESELEKAELELNELSKNITINCFQGDESEINKFKQNAINSANNNNLNEVPTGDINPILFPKKPFFTSFFLSLYLKLLLVAFKLF